MAGPTLALSRPIREAGVTHHRARDLLFAAADGMRQIVGPDPGRGPFRALRRHVAGPAPTRAAPATARFAVQPLDQSPLHAGGQPQPQLLGEAVAIRDHPLDRHHPLVGSRQLKAQDGTPQHLHLLHLAVVVKSLFLARARALLPDRVTTPGVEVTRGLPLAADERMYHCQRFSSFRPTA